MFLIWEVTERDPNTRCLSPSPDHLPHHLQECVKPVTAAPAPLAPGSQIVRGLIQLEDDFGAQVSEEAGGSYPALKVSRGDTGLPLLLKVMLQYRVHRQSWLVPPVGSGEW